MKILYAIQGTGNGHLSRARDIVPILARYGELDLVVSGTQAEVDFPFPIKYRYHGLSLIFGTKGGVDIKATYRQSNLRRLSQEINHLPVEQYHLVITDFEPVSAWACYNRRKACIGLSHQVSLNFKESPRPKRFDPVGQLTLRHYAPVTDRYGFHFRSYHENIFTPVIRQQIRELDVANDGHYTVYLPAYDDQRIIKVLSKIAGVRWQVFSKHSREVFQRDNVSVQPINNEAFLQSLAGAEGVLCGGGFETPAEVLFLKKKLMVIPMKGQYEQQCNAAALKAMGVPVIKNLKTKRIPKIEKWLADQNRVAVDYPDETERILQMIIEKHGHPELTPSADTPRIKGWKDLEQLSVRKILEQLGKGK
ncbi:MAG: glycosyltransferase family protein [Saprospiraceae bacterium]|nr:hypothetical protein [Lewinella sp.]